jgi:hypothetical protein
MKNILDQTQFQKNTLLITQYISSCFLEDMRTAYAATEMDSVDFNSSENISISLYVYYSSHHRLARSIFEKLKAEPTNDENTNLVGFYLEAAKKDLEKANQLLPKLMNNQLINPEEYKVKNERCLVGISAIDSEIACFKKSLNNVASTPNFVTAIPSPISFFASNSRYIPGRQGHLEPIMIEIERDKLLRQVEGLLKGKYRLAGLRPCVTPEIDAAAYVVLGTPVRYCRAHEQVGLKYEKITNKRLHARKYLIVNSQNLDWIELTKDSQHLLKDFPNMLLMTRHCYYNAYAVKNKKQGADANNGEHVTKPLTGEKRKLDEVQVSNETSAAKNLSPESIAAEAMVSLFGL